MAGKTLTSQYRLFIAHYIRTRCAWEAYMNVYKCNKVTATRAGPRLLKNPLIGGEISRRITLIEKKIQMTDKDILEGIRELALGAMKESDRLAAYKLLGEQKNMFKKESDDERMKLFEGRIIALPGKVPVGTKVTIIEEIPKPEEGSKDATTYSKGAIQKSQGSGRWGPQSRSEKVPARKWSTLPAVVFKTSEQGSA